jgi:hypothetical protein
LYSKRGKVLIYERQRLLELALKGLEADRTRLQDEIIQIKRELKNGIGAAESAESVLTTATGRKRAADERGREKENFRPYKRYLAS